MREYTSKVDKLEEAEQQRATEAKEENNKPIVMGKFSLNIQTFYLSCCCLLLEMTLKMKNTNDDGHIVCPGLGVDVAVVVFIVQSQPNDT